jgi:DhnA family fructose-bisphosphate aldolase class Ia
VAALDDSFVRGLLNPRTGCGVIVAMDHGISGGAVRGLEAPARVLDEVLGGRPDGVLLGPNLARHLLPRLRDADVPLWLTLDAYSTSTVPGEDGDLTLYAPIAAPAVARDLGARGVKALLVFGQNDHRDYVDNVRAVSLLAEQAHRAGLPMMVEAVLWGRRIPDDRRDHPASVQHACRIAFELGADLVKTTMPKDGLREVVASTPVPVLILGGDRGGDDAAFLRDVAGAIANGARGVVCGRSIWQNPAPARMVRALTAIVHDRRPVADVLGG